ncbi:MAG: hypothetical protein FWG09_05675 [Synergistaceae bacterium]|nr:hypothetical protein [Synergistaceae bacterium]
MARIMRVILFIYLLLAPHPGAAAASGPTVEEMAAQMLMVGFRGTNENDVSAMIGHIKAGYAGNVIIFDRDFTRTTTTTAAGSGQFRNIVSPEQLIALTKLLKDAAQTATKIPIWIAIDQEGGKVQRLRPEKGFAENYPSARALGRGDVEATRDVAERMGRELKKMGVDVNFAPVADVDVKSDSPAIGRFERSFSADPEAAARHVIAFSDGLSKAGVVPCLKHFPGHGSAEDDTHMGTADVTPTWTEAELTPYRMAFEGGFQGLVMTCHVFNGKLDALYPASLSSKITTGLLRGALGWNGIVITDDLHMGALTQHYTIEEIIFRAVDAGADILIFSSNAKNMDFDPDFPKKAHEILVSLVNEGAISKERLYESWDRIVTFKRLQNAD